MGKIQLSEEEEDLLVEYFHTTPIELIRLKALAVRMKARGLKAGEIGGYVGRGERTIRRWVNDFRQRRMASLFGGHADNENASKLTREQKRQIKETLKKPPASMIYQKSFGISHS